MSADYEAAKSEQHVQVETVTREVQKIIDRPVYLNHCFDDDGLSNSTHLSPVVPANLLEPCPDLQKLESGQGKVAFVWSIDVVARSNDCKARHAAIVKAIK